MNLSQPDFLPYDDFVVGGITLKTEAEFNYKISYNKKNSGLSIRLYGGLNLAGDNYRTPFHLGATTGLNDYGIDYSWLGRSETQGLLSQQVIMNEGQMKFRTDALITPIGVSGNWIASLNLRTTLPLPIVFLFADFGAAPSFAYSKLQTDAGLGVSLFKGGLEIYAPLFFSKDISMNLVKPDDLYSSKFLHRILFSININKLDLFNLGDLIKI